MTSIMDQEYPIIIPYKIDRVIENTGRHLAITKRHYHCRFGFAHIPSILQGESGAGCRGVEMEIHLIWSIASGKREIHFNKSLLYHDVVPNRGVQRFDHTFTIPEFTVAGGHIIHITAQTFALSEAEQFVVTVNGQNYYEFLSIYELGGARMNQIYGMLLDNYARYRRGTKQLQFADRVGQNENIADRAKYLPVPEEGKIKDAKNYSMLPTSKREERKMTARATEQSLQDTSAMDTLHRSSLERLSSVRSYRSDGKEETVVHHPTPQAPLPVQPDVDLLGLTSGTGTVKPPSMARETPEQMLLSFPGTYSSYGESKSQGLHSSSFSVSASGRDTPLMYAAPPPAWETLQSDFSFSFASPPYQQASETKSYHHF